MTRAQALDYAREEGLALGLECPRDMGALVERLHAELVLPALDLGIAQVMPDILAEALVIRTLSKRTTREQEEAIVRAAQREWPSVVPFVLRMVQDFDSERTSHPIQWVEALIRAGVADRPSLPAEIEAAMPRHTLALREKAVEVIELLLDRLTAIPGGPDGKQLAQVHPETFLPDLARSCATRGAVLRSMQRDAESANSFEQGIRALTTPFRHLPPAFSPLMIALCRDYLEAALTAQQEFDTALLASVQKVLETSRRDSPRK